MEVLSPLNVQNKDPQDAEIPRRDSPSRRRSFLLFVRRLLLVIAAAFFVLHFLHLSADFPNNSPWVDWSKYTDEGWYGDAAIRHFVLGHWYVAGDFNPAVALPVWPLMEAALFHFTGVSLTAARAFSVCVFGCTLGLVYLLLERWPRVDARPNGVSLAAPLALCFFCVSPFFYVFSRVAILEPPLILFTVLALVAATRQVPWESLGSGWPVLAKQLGRQAALGILLVTMVLTKTTAAALIPAILYLLWSRAGYRWWPAVRLAALPVAVALTLWLGYMSLLVRPHYQEDYAYLFSANAYTGFQLQPLATVLANTFADGHWMGGVLYPAFFVILVLTLFGRPAFFRNPLVPALLLWAGGYFAFLAYHNNLQPRYYLVLAVPLTVLVALGLEEFRYSSAKRVTRGAEALRASLLILVVAAILVPDALLQMSFVLHPEYTFVHAAQAIAQIVRADCKQSPLVLSISGSDLTLMTGLPSIDDDFGTLDLDKRVEKYRPGWYVAWNLIEDDKMDALRPLYRPVRVATFAAMDDADRDQLILYRLDPVATPAPVRRRSRQTPRPLQTRIGQQPTTSQLQH